MMDSNNALLPPLDWEDFQLTATYKLLAAHPADCTLLCNIFSAGGLSELEFSANPRRPFHTMYDYDDFAETVNFLRYSGKPVRLPPAMSQDIRRCFSVFDTSVGRFAICRTNSRKIEGILNAK